MRLDIYMQQKDVEQEVPRTYSLPLIDLLFGFMKLFSWFGPYLVLKFLNKMDTVTLRLQSY